MMNGFPKRIKLYIGNFFVCFSVFKNTEQCILDIFFSFLKIGHFQKENLKLKFKKNHLFHVFWSQERTIFWKKQDQNNFFLTMCLNSEIWKAPTKALREQQRWLWHKKLAKKVAIKPKSTECCAASVHPSWQWRAGSLLPLRAESLLQDPSSPVWSWEVRKQNVWLWICLQFHWAHRRWPATWYPISHPHRRRK